MRWAGWGGNGMVRGVGWGGVALAGSVRGGVGWGGVAVGIHRCGAHLDLCVTLAQGLANLLQSLELGWPRGKQRAYHLEAGGRSQGLFATGEPGWSEMSEDELDEACRAVPPAV